jgi:glutamyl-tRNA synthetase
VHAALEGLAKEKSLGLGKVAQPLRVAVSGGTVSPPIDVTLALLGQARTLARLDRALAD